MDVRPTRARCRLSVVARAVGVIAQSIDLAVAAEELGADGAYFRVHHFARQLGSLFPLLAAIGAKTRRIEIGTAVIDMRYENPLYVAEDAGAADIIACGRLQLGISRGSPEQVIDGWRYFGYAPPEAQTDVDMARRHRVRGLRFAVTILSLFALLDERIPARFYVRERSELVPCGCAPPLRARAASRFWVHAFGHRSELGPRRFARLFDRDAAPHTERLTDLPLCRGIDLLSNERACTDGQTRAGGVEEQSILCPSFSVNQASSRSVSFGMRPLLHPGGGDFGVLRWW
jgi:hypothetical protein